MIVKPAPRGALILACRKHGRPATIYYGDAPHIAREHAARRISEFSDTHKRLHPECLETWIEEELVNG